MDLYGTYGINWSNGPKGKNGLELDEWTRKRRIELNVQIDLKGTLDMDGMNGPD